MTDETDFTKGDWTAFEFIGDWFLSYIGEEQVPIYDFNATALIDCDEEQLSTLLEIIKNVRASLAKEKGTNDPA